MKNFRLTAAALIAGFAFFSSCDKNNDTPVQTTTPLQNYISGDTSLSIFNAAIQRANNSALYAGNDSVTILAPTNNAFRAAGITASSINNMTASAVDSLLRYNIINGNVNLTNGSYKSYSSQLGTTLYGYGGVADSNYFNGSRASKQAAITGSKATVYKLNSTVGIPSASTAQLLGSDTSLTFFNEAVRRSGVSLAATGANGNTIFAPTNAAFRTAGYANLNSITTGDSAKLRSLVQYHVLPTQQYFTNSFNGMSTVTTASTGNNIGISNSGGVTQFTGTGNTSGATITGSNRLAAPNTVVQTINGVLKQ